MQKGNLLSIPNNYPPVGDFVSPQCLCVTKVMELKNCQPLPYLCVNWDDNYHARTTPTTTTATTAEVQMEQLLTTALVPDYAQIIIIIIIPSLTDSATLECCWVVL